MLDANLLKCWLIADRGLTLNGTLASSGATPPSTALTISGNLSQSSGIAFRISDVTAGTNRGQAKFNAYNDGGTNPVATGLTTQADVDLTALLGVHVQWPVWASYATDQLFTATIATWTDQFAGHVFSGPGTVSQSPTAIWQGLNNRPVINSVGSNNPRLTCTDSLASIWNGDDAPITVFMVMQSTNATVTAALPWLNFGNTGGGTTERWDFGVVNTASYRSTKVDGAGGAATPSGGTLDALWHYGTWNSTGTVLTQRLDGAAVSLSGSGAQNVGTCSFNVVTLFARTLAGAVSTGIAGSIAELLIYAGSLGTSSVSEKETYLKTQWRL
jgi:hypothetical protein